MKANKIKIRYSSRLTSKICRKLELGQSISSILKEPGMPSQSCFYKWQNTRGDFATKIYQAKIQGCLEIAFEIIEIADNVLSIEGTFRVTDSKQIKCTELVARSKIKIDARKWHLSKLLPKKFGNTFQIGSNSFSGLANALKEARLKCSSS